MNDPTYVCLSCLSQQAPIRGRCPSCGTLSFPGESLVRNLADYSHGLDRGTRSRSVAVESETQGRYFAVVDTISGERLMCGFDSAEQAFRWCIVRGWMPARNDADTLRILNLLEISEA